MVGKASVSSIFKKYLTVGSDPVVKLHEKMVETGYWMLIVK